MKFISIFVSFQFKRGIEDGFGQKIFKTDNPLKTAEDVDKLRKAIEEDFEIDSAVILNIQKLPIK